MVQDGQIEYTNPVGGFRGEPCRSCRKLGWRKKGWSEGREEGRGGEEREQREAEGREREVDLVARV